MFGTKMQSVLSLMPRDITLHLLLQLILSDKVVACAESGENTVHTPVGVSSISCDISYLTRRYFHDVSVVETGAALYVGLFLP